MIDGDEKQCRYLAPIIGLLGSVVTHVSIEHQNIIMDENIHKPMQHSNNKESYVHQIRITVKEVLNMQQEKAPNQVILLISPLSCAN